MLAKAMVLLRNAMLARPSPSSNRLAARQTTRSREHVGQSDVAAVRLSLRSSVSLSHSENCVKTAEPIVMVPALNRSLPNTAHSYNLPVFVL